MTKHLLKKVQSFNDFVLADCGCATKHCWQRELNQIVLLLQKKILQANINFFLLNVYLFLSLY